MVAMPKARFTAALLILVAGSLGAAAFSLTGCADEDPNYGPPEGIRGRQVDFGGGATEPEPAGDGGGTSTVKTARELFDDLYKSTSSSCGSCHLTGSPPGATIFYGADANATYPLFKAKGYDKANSAFYTKALPHVGGSLTADQKKLVDLWVAAEAGGGGAGPADAAGGG